MISVSLALRRGHPLRLRDHGYRASASRGVLVYSPAFAGTRCDCTQRDGQAKLTWVASYILGWYTHQQTALLPIPVLTGPDVQQNYVDRDQRVTTEPNLQLTQLPWVPVQLSLQNDRPIKI